MITFTTPNMRHIWEHLSEVLNSSRSSLKVLGLKQTLLRAPFFLLLFIRRFRERKALEAEGQYEFDRLYGTNTAGTLEQFQLDFTGNSRGRTRYRPTPHSVFRRSLDMVLERLRVRNESVDQYAFIDYGSGKGVCLMLALHYPFRAIVGLEYHSALCDISRKNVEIYRKASLALHRTEPIVKCGDAANYAIGYDKIVCFFYEPFGIRTLLSVVEQLRSVANQGSVIIVSVGHNAFVDVFEVQPWLRKSASDKVSFGGEHPWRMDIYESKAAEMASRAKLT